MVENVSGKRSREMPRQCTGLQTYGVKQQDINAVDESVIKRGLAEQKKKNNDIELSTKNNHSYRMRNESLK